MTDKTEPMDPSVHERVTGIAHHPRERNAYALDTLITEVMDLFPETTYEVSGRDLRGVALHVQFFIEHEGLAALLTLLDSDPRVEEVVRDDEEVLVALRSSARTQDSRDSFGLTEAWEVIAEDYEGYRGSM